MSIKFQRRFFAMLAVASSAAAACGQSVRTQDLGIGKILVARRDLPDPNFARTVILLIQYENDGTVGLMINRPTKVAVSEALEELNGTKERSEPVYSGGPVDRQRVFALLRAAKMPDDAAHVVGKLYVITTRALLEKTLASRTGPEDLRLYVGYSGWSKEQLENEVKLGAWYIVPGTAELALDSEPESLWSRLIARAEQQIAGSRPYRPPIAALWIAPPVDR